MALKLYSSVPKRLELRARTFSGLTPAVVEVTGETLVAFLDPHLEYS